MGSFIQLLAENIGMVRSPVPPTRQCNAPL
jgi:hypothetical protein